MKTILVTLLALFSASLVFASGGMIGGGEVNFKSLVACDAQGIDPTHAASPYVWVVKEVNYDGTYLADAPLRVVTVNKNHEPIQFYVAHAKDLIKDSKGQFNLALWRYDLGSSGNYKTGLFVWDEKSNSGELSSVGDKNEVEELQLSNCILTP